MLLNRSILNLAKLASKDVSRYTLSAIAVEKDKAIVTDTTILVCVGNTSPIANADFPSVPGLVHKTFADGPTPELVLVSRDAALSALKSLPKTTTIPVLSNAAMGTNGKLYTTDLDNVSQFKHEMTGKFPNWRAVMPAADKTPSATITFDARKMRQLCQYFVENGNERMPAVKLTVYDAESAMKLEGTTADGQKITALLMPYHID